jgi:hypothetical protein
MSRLGARLSSILHEDRDSRPSEPRLVFTDEKQQQQQQPQPSLSDDDSADERPPQPRKRRKAVHTPSRQSLVRYEDTEMAEEDRSFYAQETIDEKETKEQQQQRDSSDVVDDEKESKRSATYNADDDLDRAMREEDDAPVLQFRRFTDTADALEAGARPTCTLIPVISTANTRFSQVDAFEYMKKHDLLNRVSPLAATGGDGAAAGAVVVEQSRFDKLMQRCRDVVRYQIEVREQLIGRKRLVSREEAISNARNGDALIEQQKQQAELRFNSVVQGLNQMTRTYMESRLQWGEQASLDAMQEEIAGDIALSCAPFIYGDVWSLCKQRLLRRLMIKGIKRWTMITMPRQMGKTFLFSVFCAWLMLYCPRIYIIVLSVNENSAKRLIGTVQEVLQSSVGNNKHWIRSQSEKEISVLQPSVRGKYAGGKSCKGEKKVNRIKALPGKVESVRGEAPDVIVIDEAAFMSARMFMDNVLPIAGNRNRVILGISTPGGEMNWFTQITEVMANLVDTPFRIIVNQLACMACRNAGREAQCEHNKYLLPSYKDPEVTRVQRMILPEDVYIAEVQGIVVASGAKVFQQHHVRALRNRPHYNFKQCKVIWITVDPSGGSTVGSRMAIWAHALNRASQFVVRSWLIVVVVYVCAVQRRWHVRRAPRTRLLLLPPPLRLLLLLLPLLLLRHRASQHWHRLAPSTIDRCDHQGHASPACDPSGIPCGSACAFATTCR